MASGEQRETLAVALGKRRSKDIDEEEGEGEEEEREIEELGREVRAIAEKILQSRRTMPERVSEAFSSHLVAQRSVLPQTGSKFSTTTSSLSVHSEQAGTSGNLSSELRENAELSEGASLAEADPVVLQKLRTFRDKTASNIAAMPVILKRMNECIARLDRIDQYNVNLHSAFKRKRKQ